jgi:hypothetical protein
VTALDPIDVAYFAAIARFCDVCGSAKDVEWTGYRRRCPNHVEYDPNRCAGGTSQKIGPWNPDPRALAELVFR